MYFDILYFSQCFASALLELLILSTLVYFLKKETFKLSKHTLFILLLFTSVSALITYIDDNSFIYRLLNIFTLIIYFRILTGTKIIHSLYLTIISYICALIIQICIMAIFQFTITNQDNFLVQLFGNFLTLILAYILARILPIHYIYDYVIKKDRAFRFLLGNTFVAFVFFNYLATAHLTHFLYYIITIAIVVALLVFINVELLRSRVIVDKQKAIIDNYNKYLPIVDELIEQVRGRQHGYDNNIQSLKALALTCNDYETLRSELMKNTDIMSHSDLPMHLLKFNLKLLSGLLLQKHALAKKQGIDMDFTIRNFNIQTAVPEYIIVEATGILMDNAIEASNEDDAIYITIDCTQNKFYFRIMNIGPTYTSEFHNNIFTRGYTTKSSTGRNNGLGLNHLLEMSKKYNGRLEVGNDDYNGRQYVYFSIEF